MVIKYFDYPLRAETTHQSKLDSTRHEGSRMFKKILMLALLTLNMPSHTAHKPRLDLSAICITTGVMCTWLAYKNLKKGWQANKEIGIHIKILNDMGVKVCTESKGDFDPFSGSLVIKERLTMKAPSNLSQQQKKTVNEYWNLLLTNYKDLDNMLGYPAIGSVILLPCGIWGLFEWIQEFNKSN